MKVAEPLSVVLRRLHEEATTQPIITAMAADRRIRRALPALADLVARMERWCGNHPEDGPGDPCNCEDCLVVRALRSQLEGR